MPDEQRQPRQHDPEYLDYIRQQPCCICGDNTATEAAHLRVGIIGASVPKRATGMGEKSSDRWALPLCGKHHREQHSMNELEFWASYGIDPFALSIHYTMRQRVGR
ncbi:MAG: DUF968 domain-containing protein [Rhizobiales bacterium]|nr:DUF968 domain-containing protein [Hyphomicrobiales bacterium]